MGWENVVEGVGAGVAASALVGRSVWGWLVNALAEQVERLRKEMTTPTDEPLGQTLVEIRDLLRQIAEQRPESRPPVRRRNP